jgi:hypothetical protein
MRWRLGRWVHKNIFYVQIRVPEGGLRETGIFRTKQRYGFGRTCRELGSWVLWLAYTLLGLRTSLSGAGIW